MPEIFNATTTAGGAQRHRSTTTAASQSQEVTPEPGQEANGHRLTEEHRRGRHVDEYSKIMRAERPSSNPFASFAPKPVNTCFDAQHDEEQVLLLLRQSLITQIKFVIIIIGLALLPILFNGIGMLDFLPTNFQVVANLGWYLIVASFALEVFLSWFYNVYIVTDERVIDVDFTSLIAKNVAYAKIDNIEDITSSTAGLLGSVFDYGDVRIQTAGAVTQFEFLSVPHPSKVVAFINELMIEEEQEKLLRRAN